MWDRDPLSPLRCRVMTSFKNLYFKFNDKPIFKCYSEQRKKQDHRSGKERQCCRYIHRLSEVYIARAIFWVRLCLQPIKLNGLIRHALTRPDQVDIWDQVPLCAYWNEQIKTVILQKLPLVREDRRFFCAEMEKSQMKRYLRGHSDTKLLPSGEINEKGIKTDDQILMNNKAV